MGQIFISYSHKDKTYVYKLHQTLLKHGFDAWADDRQDDGVSWPNEIEARLKECDAFILVMSPAAKVSTWVQNELRLAIESHKTIFPLRFDGDVWLDVFRLHSFDIRGGMLPDTNFYARLAEISHPGMPRDSSSFVSSLDADALRPITLPTAAPKTTSHTIVENRPAESPTKTVTKRVLDEVNQHHQHRHLITINLLGLVVMIFATMMVLKPFFTPPTLISTPTNKPTSIPSATSLPREIMQGSAKMVLVPAGPFIMGSNKGGWNEEPVRTVDLPTFYIDAYEVTNLLYKACVTTQTCQPPMELSILGYTNPYDNAEYNQYPVVSVDWEMAKTYCEWRGARLPSEAEWEKAARGTDGRTYPWGEKLDNIYTEYLSGDGGNLPVGAYEKGKSPYNVYDTVGNVEEWVADWYDRYPGSSAKDANFGQTHRALRGGGVTGIHAAPVSFRFGGIPSYAGSDVGFRCAFSVFS